ncbi:MAG: GTP-binding protein [Intestinimonas sp.]
MDFSAEMERTLRVLDCAILVISGTDGVQGHTRTLWRLLEQYGVPTFVFINKMDLPGADRAGLLAGLKRRLGDGCTDFGAEGAALLENVAVCDEAALERYLEAGTLSDGEVAGLVGARSFSPATSAPRCCLEGGRAAGGAGAVRTPAGLSPEFGARVYKISRDAQGGRLTHLKVTGGRLRVKDLLTNRRADLGEEQIWEEKADQIRIYSGERYRAVEEVPAGTVCAVTGLSRTYPGEGLGWERAPEPPALEPVLTYQVLLPRAATPTGAAEAPGAPGGGPQLHIVWNEPLRRSTSSSWGRSSWRSCGCSSPQRFGLEVGFSAGSIVYRETIAAPVEGGPL